MLRRTVGAALSGGLLILAGLVAWWSPALPRQVEPISAGSPTQAASPSAAPSAPSAPVPETDSTPRARLPVDGPGISAPGISQTLIPQADGSFMVLESVRLRRSTTTLTVQPPEVAQAGRRFAALQPVAWEIQVTAGDQPVYVPPTSIKTSTTLTWSVPASRVELAYRLDGVSVRSIPSRAGRSLAAIQPLTLPAIPAENPVRVTVVGETVLSLNCPLLTGAAAVCSAGSPPRMWVLHPLSASKALVVVQYDRPAVR